MNTPNHEPESGIGRNIAAALTGTTILAAVIGALIGAGIVYAWLAP